MTCLEHWSAKGLRNTARYVAFASTCDRQPKSIGCEILGCDCSVGEVLSLLGCCTLSMGVMLPTFQDSMTVPLARVQVSMGQDCPKMS